VIFTPLELAGAFLIDVEARHDERGLFARTYCDEEFAAHGVAARFRQCSVSYNARRGTLRGMHFQREPHAEDKLVRCAAGAVFDVIVDLRPGSATYRRWVGAELGAADRRALLVPRGCAHGFLTLTDGAEVFYMISTPYVAEFSDGFRWDDPAVGIDWPFPPAIVSARDAALPRLAGG